MGELGAFLKIKRAETPERPPGERVGDHREFVRTLPLVELREQGARCMECGVPFCHSGCPLGNLIPDWNDLVYRDRFREALDQLHRTNNFPEFTGRLCPAPCEAACVLEIDEGNAVTIKQIELAIVDRGWEEGWIVPRPPARRTGKTVAVVGSGPAGLACAQQLARSGHSVTVFERDEAGGGLLRFGVPDFKIEKRVVERRLQQMTDESVEFRFGHEVTGPLAGFDATVLATGSRVPRDLPVPGRELGGVHFAMEYLYGRNRAIAGTAEPPISATGRHVIVIGGGDTGADCVASAHREGAASVTQIELLGEPPASRPDDVTPWPLWPMKLRTSYALKEGGERSFAVSTTGLTGNGSVQQIHWLRNTGAPPFEPVPETDESRPAQLVLLAMGFVGPEPGLLDALGVARDARGNVDAAEFATSAPGVFAAGDARRGQSLIVWAIDEGRRCARAVDAYLS
jgi:glutamate synthase (NADPH) small chain